MIIKRSITLVNPNFAARLYALKGYEIVLICDDSGSMTAPISESFISLLSIDCLLLSYLGETNNPSQKARTRCEISSHILAKYIHICCV